METKLYGGKVVVEFKENPYHTYKINGGRVDSVTGIIGIKDKSQPLIYWAVGLCKDYLTEKIEELTGGNREAILSLIDEASKQYSIRKQESATIGDKIHTWCEEYITAKLTGGVAPEMPEEKSVQIGVVAFLDWEEKHKVKFISSERVLYSKKYKYSGKMDIEATVDGKLCVVDLKSSNALYKEVGLQTSAYLKADEEESGKKYDGRWAVRLSKETEDEYITRMEKKAKKDYSPYQVFEAKELLGVDEDFKAFLACQNLYDWDKQKVF